MLTWLPEDRIEFLGAVSLPTEWFNSGCGSGPRARWLPSGAIEIEGEGTPTRKLPKGVLKWKQHIYGAAQKHSLPYQFIAGVMGLESSGNEKAKSPANACGLMQLIPSTASNQAGRLVTCQELLNDPVLNIDLGSRYLAELWQRYDGNAIRITTAYNAGKAICGKGKSCDTPNRWNLLTDCPEDQNTGVRRSVDYPGRVIEYSNSAIEELGKPSGIIPGATFHAQPASTRLGFIAIVGALSLGYLAYERYRRAA